jgi:hypothetical protein
VKVDNSGYLEATSAYEDASMVGKAQKQYVMGREPCKYWQKEEH